MMSAVKLKIVYFENLTLYYILTFRLVDHDAGIVRITQRAYLTGFSSADRFRSLCCLCLRDVYFLLVVNSHTDLCLFFSAVNPFIIWKVSKDV